MYYNNKRLALSIFWMILGAVLIGLTIGGVIDSSLYSGMGGALCAVGALQVCRNLKYRKDAEYRKKIDVEAGDERLRYLRMNAWAWTGYAVVLIEALGGVVATIAGWETVRLILSCSVCLILIVYWVSYLILSKRY